mgnify:CR=1 FL=1
MTIARTTMAVLIAAAGLTAAGDADGFLKNLEQRNALLRREGRRADRTTLDVWDDRLALLGARVAGRRIALVVHGARERAVVQR